MGRWDFEVIPKTKITKLKRAVKKYPSFAAFSLAVGVERSTLYYILDRGTATHTSIERINEFLQKQTT